MDLKEKIKTIPKEIYNDVQEICEITFMKGTSIYAEELIPERIQEKEKIWKIFLNEKNDTYTIFDLQAYLALEKMIEKDKKEISDIIIELYKECEINELLSRRRLIVLHNIAKYYPKEFNKEFLLVQLNHLINDIKKTDNILITESLIKEIYEELKIFIKPDNTIYSIYKKSIIYDVLSYIGMDFITEINNIEFKKYDIILKNMDLSFHDKKNEKDNDSIEIRFDKLSENPYFIEILDNSGFFDKMVGDYSKLQKLIVFISKNLENDFWLYFDQE
mgnify:CR=1 FL=1